MSRFWENLRKNRRKDEQKDGRTDGPYFIGPFRPRPGDQKWTTVPDKQRQQNILQSALFSEKCLSTIKFPSTHNFAIIQQLNPIWLAFRCWKLGENLIVDHWNQFAMNDIDWRFPNRVEKEKRAAYSKETWQQFLENYRLVSLLPICGKILEGLIFNEISRVLKLKIPLLRRYDTIAVRIVLRTFL